MDEYRTYLATKVLNEDLIVNYRQLSRALKVHTHLAKQMLYEFHAKQTGKKPGSIHATYLITGTLRAEPTASAVSGRLTQLDGDTIMDSSPFPSSFPEPDLVFSLESDDAEPAEETVSATTVLLVREEELEEAKGDFDEIDSIFVYSLEPGPLKDFQLLAQCNREVTQTFFTEDPLQSYKTYGIIQNPEVRRRTGKRPLPPAVPVVAPAAAKAVLNSASQAKETSSSVKTEAPKSSTSAKPASTMAPKRQSSDLFKSFAKTKPPKLKTSGTNSTSASGNPSPVDDEPMQGMSEDEADDDDQEMVEAEAAAQAEKAEASRKARKEKEEKLRKMMEDDDDEDSAMADAESPEEEAEVVDESEALDKQPVEEKKEEVVVSDGRRRGRRRVMKKKTFKDEDGYLVTKEEAAWESFSEDEPVSKKLNISVAPATAKKGAAAATKSQGNIMNFFKKK